MTELNGFRMENTDHLWDHIAYVMEYAPDRFPYEVELKPSQQMTLDTAFLQLHQGVDIAIPASQQPHRDTLNALLDRALNEYRSGAPETGKSLLGEFEAIVFTPEGKLRGAP
jgi:hypothetical protein